MKEFYNNQLRGRYPDGLKKLSLLLVMMIFTVSAAFSQSLSSNSPVCVGNTLTLTFSVGTCTGVTGVTFTGPNGFNQTDNTSPYSVARAGMTVADAGTYTATVSGGSCDGQAFNTTVWVGVPAKPVISGANKACVNEVTTYTTPTVPGQNYLWSISQPDVYGSILNAGTSLGVEFASVKWYGAAVGNSAWVKVTATNACGGTQSDQFNVAIYDNPITPTCTPAQSEYCHGEDGVTLTVGNVQANNTYQLIITPGDIVVDTYVASSAADFTFDDVQVVNHSDPGEHSTDFYVQAVNPNVCFAQSTTVSVTKYAEPAVLFSVNDVNASYQSHYYFCYDEDITVKLSEILSPNPTGQVDITWTVSPDPGGLLSGSLTGVQAGDVLFGPDVLDAGTYTVNLTYLEDENGCQPTDYSIYELYVTIWEEPTLDILIGGSSVVGDDLEYCFDDDIEFTIQGDDGDPTWTFDWQVEYAGGSAVPGFEFTDDWVDTPENKSFSASLLTPGDYTARITALVDGNGCETSVATLATLYVNFTIHPEPTLDITIDDDPVAASQEFCWDDSFEFCVAGGAGTQPWTFDYEIWYDDGTNPSVKVDEDNIVLTTEECETIDVKDYAAGTYSLKLISLKDGKDCVNDNPSDFNFEIVVHPEPTLAISIGEDATIQATPDPIEYFCWDDQFTICMEGVVGTPDWTVQWAVTGPGGPYGDVMTGTEDCWDFDCKDFDAGTYDLSIVSLEDAEGCFASATTLDSYGFQIVIHPKPVVDNITLDVSETTDMSDPWAVSGDYQSGFQLCINTDPDKDYYLDVNTLTLGTSSPALRDGTLPNEDGLFGFYYADDYSTELNAFFDGKWGSGWQTSKPWGPQMAAIIAQTEPVAYLYYDGSEYHLIDGMQWDFASAEVPMTIPANFPEGTYDLEGYVYSEDDCVSDLMEMSFTFDHMPVVTAASLIVSEDPSLASPSTLDGNLQDGYELCIDDNVDYYYFGVSTLTEAQSKSLEVNHQNAFYLDVTSVPTTPVEFYNWWATEKGVDGTNNAQGWELAMWEIIHGNQPMFYLVYDGTNYSLVDGLSGNTLKLDGNYPPGNYKYDGTVKAANGCVSEEFSIMIEMTDYPNPDAGLAHTVCNSTSYTLQGAPSLTYSDLKWTYTGPGTANFDNDEIAGATVKVDVAGTYTFTLTETNGDCENSDDVDITFLMGTDAEATTMYDSPDISTIPETPFMVYSNAQYPDLTGTDNSILVDAYIEHTSGTFPAGAKVIKVNYQFNSGGWIDVPIADGTIIGGTAGLRITDLFASPWDVAQPLVGHSNGLVEWQIFIEGVNTIPSTNPIPVKISTITYETWSSSCYAELASDEFTVTFANEDIDEIADITECYPENIEYSYDATYPLIENISQGKDETITYRVFNDGRFSFYSDALLQNPVDLPSGTKISVNTPAGHDKTSTLTVDAGVIYGSAIITEQGDPTSNSNGFLLPLDRAAGTGNWTVTIEGAPAGTIYVKVEDLALLHYDGLDLNAGNGYLNSGTTFDEVYVYNEDDFKVIYVGADGISIDPEMDDYATVTGTPLVIDATVNYGAANNLIDQNIDPSVLVDALFTSVGGDFPEGAEIIDVLYNGNPVSGFTGYTIPATTSELLLSTILGSSAQPLIGHDGRIDTWTLTIGNVNTAQTVTTKVESIAYVDYNECSSVLAEDEFEMTWADATLTVLPDPDPDPVCEDDAAGITFTFDITYPTILNLVNDVLADCQIESDETVNSGTVIEWDYNSGAASGSYTLTSDLDEIKLSVIVGGAAPYPLSGHSGITDNWSFTVKNLDPEKYNLTLTPIATLDGVDYEYYSEGSVDSEAVLLHIVPTPEPTVSYDEYPDKVFAGSTHTYSVDVVSTPDYSYTYKYDWTIIDGTIVDGGDGYDWVEVKWDFPQPWVEFEDYYTGNVEVTVTNNTYDPYAPCSASDDMDVDVYRTKLSGQLLYFNQYNTPMPSPYGFDVLGGIPLYMYVGLGTITEQKGPNGYEFEYQVSTVEPYFDVEKGEWLAYYEFWDVPAANDYVINVFDNIGWLEELLGGDGLKDGGDALSYLYAYWGGCTALDALAIQIMVGGELYNPPYNFWWTEGTEVKEANYNLHFTMVADVNTSGDYIPNQGKGKGLGISALDALTLKYRLVGLIPNFPYTGDEWTNPFYYQFTPDFRVGGLWVDELGYNAWENEDIPTDAYYPVAFNPLFTAYGNGDPFGLGEQGVPFVIDEFTDENFYNFYFTATGDVNASYVPQNPGFKAAPAQELVYEDEVEVVTGQTLEVPVYLDRSFDMSAAVIGLTYRNDLVEVLSITGPEGGEPVSNVTDEFVRLAWTTLDPVYYNAGDVLATIEVKVLGEITADTRLFELESITELVNSYTEVEEGLTFKSVSLSTLGGSIAAGELEVTSMPNPFNDRSIITYNLPEAGNVSLVVYNKLGQEVVKLVDQYQEAGTYEVEVNGNDLMSNGHGMYIYKIILDGNKTYTATNSMIFMQ